MIATAGAKRRRTMSHHEPHRMTAMVPSPAQTVASPNQQMPTCHMKRAYRCWVASDKEGWLSLRHEDARPQAPPTLRREGEHGAFIALATTA